MIHKFDGKGKILFFPKKWANSVTAWLSGVYSPKGTISVKNTSSPDDNGSLGLDVNIDAVTAEIVSRISGRYLSTSDIAAIRDIVRGFVDGSSVVWNGASFGVSMEWLVEQVITRVGNVAASDIGTTASAGTSEYAARADHVHKLPNPSAPSYTDLGGGIGTSIGGGNSASSSAGSVNGSTGFTFTVLGAFNYAGDKSQIQTRTITVGRDGRIVSISACGGGKTFDTPTD